MTAKIITIAQHKGGSGKSTIAIHLAIALLQAQNKSCIIDIDPQGSSTMWYRIRTEHYHSTDHEVGFASCGGIRISNEINKLKLISDFIIIDCPPHTDTDAKAAIRAADLVLIPMQPSPADLWATQKTLEYAHDTNKNVKIVLNRSINRSTMAKNLSLPEEYMLKTTIGNRVGFASSMHLGKTMLETEPSSIGAGEIRFLAEELLKILSNSKIVA